MRLFMCLSADSACDPAIKVVVLGNMLGSCFVREVLWSTVSSHVH